MRRLDVPDTIAAQLDGHHRRGDLVEHVPAVIGPREQHGVCDAAVPGDADRQVGARPAEAYEARALGEREILAIAGAALADVGPVGERVRTVRIAGVDLAID